MVARTIGRGFNRNDCGKTTENGGNREAQRTAWKIQRLQAPTIGRYVDFFQRSRKRSEHHQLLRSLFKTARFQGEPATEFFHDAFGKDASAARPALYRKPVRQKVRLRWA
jgi:hypothetical protein